MHARYILLSVLFFAALESVAFSYSLNDASSLLLQYGVPSNSVFQLMPANVVSSGHTYMLLYNGTNLDFVINESSDSVVLNATSIYNIIRSYEINRTFAASNFTALSDLMKKFVASSSAAINTCLVLTGLNTGLTCTNANACLSCSVVPACSDLDNQMGIPDYLAQGIMQFESQYAWLNSSLNRFYSAVSGISENNLVSSLNVINGTFYNVSNLTANMYKNQLFPYPDNFSASQLSKCSTYSSTSEPWYCVDLGYCDEPTYNSSIKSSLGNELDSILSSYLTNSTVKQLAGNVSSYEMVYVYPILFKQQSKKLGIILNSTLNGYNSVVSSADALLSHVENASLSVSLQNFNSNLTILKTNFVNLNLSSENKTMAKLFLSLKSIYNGVSGAYNSVLSYAVNNTRNILEIQITNPNAQGLGPVELKQYGINQQLSGSGLVLSAGIYDSLHNVSNSLGRYSTGGISLAGMASGFDEPVISALAGVLGLDYAQAVSLAPVLGSLVSLLIGLAIFAAFVYFKMRLKKKHRLFVNEKTNKAWRKLFIILILLIILYVIITYVSLAYANTNAQSSSLQSAVSGAKSIAVVINGTATQPVLNCAANVSAAVRSLGKTAVSADIYGNTCTMSGNSLTASSCMNRFAQQGIPAVVLANSTFYSIHLYSLYGTVLDFSGNASVMNSCYVTLLLK